MLSNNSEYISLLNGIKEKIQSAQYKATLAAYVEMTKLYWEIGNDINSKRGWGSGFIANLHGILRWNFRLQQVTRSGT